VIDRPGNSDLFEQLERWPHHPSTSELVRRAVLLRAFDVCKHCLDTSGIGFHIDHVIPVSRWADYAAGRIPWLVEGKMRRGPHHLENYAWCCASCNASSGNRTSARSGTEVARLFNPRRDIWHEHFAFRHRYLHITGISLIGRAREQVRRFNDARLGGSIGPRHEAILDGRYPPPWARGWHAGRGDT
jgi:5-methylcytosine-specific restriction endonuclease McrA